MEEVGRVTHYFSRIGVAAIVLSSSLKLGDKIRIKGKTTDFEQVVESMEIEHRPVEHAVAGDIVGIRVREKVRPKDVVYRL